MVPHISAAGLSRGDKTMHAARVLNGLLLVCVFPAFGQNIEPNAGKWKTWVIPSGAAFRAPAPPDAAATRAELAWIRDVAVTTTNPNIVNSVTFWSAGAPSYRWIELLNNRSTRGAS